MFQLFLSLVPHHVFGLGLVGTLIEMSRESTFMSKNPPLIGVDGKILQFLNFNKLFNFFYLCSFLFHMFFLSYSLIMTNVGIGGEKCLRRHCNVSSNPSPTIVTHLNVSKISHSTSLSSLELSLFSQNTRGNIDASGSM
jgi:hypothetical protein